VTRHAFAIRLGQFSSALAPADAQAIRRMTAELDASRNALDVLSLENWRRKNDRYAT